MSSTETYKKVEIIERIKQQGGFRNYIEYIDFPFYKNLMPRTRIHFSFPITILVGKNGSGKSSTLHALYGAPLNKTCSDFWFSTEVDPILESGDRNRFFYGYKKDKNSEIEEVMKTRMKRGSKTKKVDPDYWETSRAIIKDGMLPSKRRTPPVEKETIYLDFRAEVSAFDKIFHFSNGSLEDRKELLRSRSKYLNRLFNGIPMRFPGKKDDAVGTVKALSEDCISIISNILGKKYVDIKIAEHKLFKNPGTSIYVKTEISSKYSEANAGSGEVAVIQLVRRIEDAPEYALILLDEPEVSIHPGAQENLKQYLLDVVIKKKLQIIISTHSPILIEDMPNSSIKLFKTNLSGKFEVREDVHYQEAFFDIEDKVLNKKIIYCEDFAAQELIVKALKSVDKAQYFDVNYIPGGEATILKTFLPSITTNEQLRNKVFLILDGDMETEYKFVEEEMTVTQRNDCQYLLNCIKKAVRMDIPVCIDGGNGGVREDQKCEAYLKYLKYYSQNIFYIPEKSIPEKLLVNSSYVKQTYGSVLSEFKEITNKNAKEVIVRISEDDYGDSEHINSTISVLANKWSQEESSAKTLLIECLEKLV